MRLLRSEADPLVSVLTTFAYDPLVEWSDRGARDGTAKKSETGEVQNDMAMATIDGIRGKLLGHGIVDMNEKLRHKRGKLGRDRLSLPLSIEGQVHKLIDQATSLDNLCRMYMGWASHL